MEPLAGIGQEKPVKKRKRAPKEERENALNAYMEGAASWTVEVDGVSVDALQEAWCVFLKNAERAPTKRPLAFLTPKVQAYRGFSRLGDVSSQDHSPLHDLPPLSTGLVALDDLATSKQNAIRVLGAKPLAKGTALACRYFKPGSSLNEKRLKSVAGRQARKETRLYAKVTKAQTKYEGLVDGICKRIMDPAKGDSVKCGACGARYPRSNLEKALPAPGDLYVCVLCDETLATAKDKERLAAARDALLSTKESYKAEAKDFGWLIRIG